MIRDVAETDHSGLAVHLPEEWRTRVPRTRVLCRTKGGGERREKTKDKVPAVVGLDLGACYITCLPSSLPAHN